MLFRIKYAILFIESEVRDMKRNVRNTTGYKVRMWFYRLTWKDIVKMYMNTRNVAVDIITIIAIFVVLFFLPAFFH